MCGLTGKLWLDPARPADLESVRALTAALAHRGPDGEGHAADGPCALGHRRLAIIDLSPRSAQPLRGAGGELLVANGEVYDHRELRAQLEALGQRFASDGDSEVLLAAYRQWWPTEGPGFLRRLPGMFAFALWDPRARRLVLGRDRLGKKPLHYALTPEGLVFASELHALVRDPLVDRRPDWQALSDYLAFKVVGHPRTAYAGARTLPPASVLVVEPGADGRLAARVERWWRLLPGNEWGAAPTLDEAADEVLARLRRAVRRRLVSDVPLGALLSGGLDSAAVVALMAQEGGEVRTFTIGFREADHDEAEGARRVARLFGTRHEELVVEPDAVALLDAALAHHGQPFADGSALPTWLVARLARRHVTVALTGDGGDEAFAGYESHAVHARDERFHRRFPAPLRALLGTGLAAGARWSGHAKLARVAGAVQRANRPVEERFCNVFTKAQRRRLFSAEARARIGQAKEETLFARLAQEQRFPDFLSQILYADTKSYLTNDILVKVDRMSMANSLEVRSPLVDHELLEFAATIPSHLKLHDGVSKYIFKKTAETFVPREIVYRRKQGFGVPIRHWFRTELRDMLHDALLGSTDAGGALFERRVVERMLREHTNGKRDWSTQLWPLLVFRMWYRRFGV